MENSNTSEERVLATVPADGGLAVIGGAEDMTERLKAFSEQQHVVLDYVDQNFVRDIDYGPTDERSPKPTLKKPGAEKICRLFGTRPTWTRDNETWEMFGRPAGVICYVCYIIDNVTGKVVGEGRGAAKLMDKSRDANKTIKIAEKCALVDAALYTFCLSEKFTQDEVSSRNGQPSLQDAKDKFVAEVSKVRRGCNSSLSDIQFAVRVSEQEVHKQRPTTLGEMNHVADVVLVRKLYDLATGDRIPPAEAMPPAVAQNGDGTFT